MLHEAFGKADTVIGDLHRQDSVDGRHAPDAELDRKSGRVRVFHRVRDDIQEDLPQSIGIGQQRREFIHDRQAEHHLLFVGHRHRRVDGVLYDVTEIHNGWLDRQGRRGEPHRIQKILHQFQLRLCVLLNDVQAVVN